MSGFKIDMNINDVSNLSMFDVESISFNKINYKKRKDTKGFQCIKMTIKGGNKTTELSCFSDNGKGIKINNDGTDC